MSEPVVRCLDCGQVQGHEDRRVCNTREGFRLQQHAGHDPHRWPLPPADTSWLEMETVRYPPGVHATVALTAALCALIVSVTALVLVVLA